MMNENDKIIDVSDDPISDSRPTDVPEISIESEADDSHHINGEDDKPRKYRSLKTGAVAVSVALAVALIAVFFARHHLSSGETQSDAAGIKDNISALSLPYVPTSAGTSVLSDSVLGVVFDMYPLEGLSASLEWEFPDTTDHSLVIFMRSADYHPDGRSLGPVVVDGVGSECKATDSRDGYVAVSRSGKAVVGISSSDDMEKWARKNKGDFFRQMVLLNDGELPRDFLLRGKVERAALASTVDGTLFYVVTRNKESMYDFADAMREFGFVNAVYMTGGNAYSFYRDPGGMSHVNAATLEKFKKYDSRSLPQPLLVFRKSDS